MFMLMCKADGVIQSRQIHLPINMRSLKGNAPLRSRNLWMDQMNGTAVSWGAQHYAFRYRGEWHLCSAYGHHEPIRSIPVGDDAQSSAEMWLIARAAHK